jgi:hypothetical protein
MLKKPRPAVRAAVEAVGEACGAMHDWLDDRRDTLAAGGVRLDRSPLPRMETEARGSIESRTTRALMFGSAWETELVLSQIKSTEYLAALAEAIADEESDGTRAARVEAFGERMRGLHRTLTERVGLRAGEGREGEGVGEGGGDAG